MNIQVQCRRKEVYQYIQTLTTPPHLKIAIKNAYMCVLVSVRVFIRAQIGERVHASKKSLLPHEEYKQIESIS